MSGSFTQLTTILLQVMLAQMSKTLITKQATVVQFLPAENLNFFFNTFVFFFPLFTTLVLQLLGNLKFKPFIPPFISVFAVVAFAIYFYRLLHVRVCRFFCISLCYWKIPVTDIMILELWRHCGPTTGVVRGNKRRQIAIVWSLYIKFSPGTQACVSSEKSSLSSGDLKILVFIVLQR